MLVLTRKLMEKLYIGDEVCDHFERADATVGRLADVRSRLILIRNLAKAAATPRIVAAHGHARVASGC